MVESGRKGVKNVKTVVRVFVAIVIVTVCLCLPISAHSGRTDGKGGHYDRSTGEYHYHHGYPAHQHPGGVCPYEHDDKTDHNSGSYSDNGSKTIGNVEIEGWIFKNEKTASDYVDHFIRIPFFTLLIFGGACYFMWIVLWVYPKIESVKKVIVVGGALIASSIPVGFLFGWSASKWLFIISGCYVAVVFAVGVKQRIADSFH